MQVCRKRHTITSNLRSVDCITFRTYVSIDCIPFCSVGKGKSSCFQNASNFYLSRKLHIYKVARKKGQTDYN
uniref:Ovule protein n=1 Tax=Romanomermis culicivorax TaxID=13658 RepID=A0A915KZ10_ROMCU